MSRYYYDLHLHSCLSPCGDNDMTPNNIANMAALAGLNIVALTDHNSTANCPAFFEAAKRAGIVPVAGMELTTAEEIHLICLFEQLEDAMAFGRVIDSRRSKTPNRPEIFGDQWILNGDDEKIGEEPLLLPPATDIALDEAVKLVEQHHGLCHPAHVDRPSNGIIAILGDMPESPRFTRAEFNDPANVQPYLERYPLLRQMQILTCSDAHNLGAIRDKESWFELEDDPYSSRLIRQRLFAALRGDPS